MGDCVNSFFPIVASKFVEVKVTYLSQNHTKIIGFRRVLANREGAGEVKVHGIGVVVGDPPLHVDVGICEVILYSLSLCCGLINRAEHFTENFACMLHTDC